MTFKWTDIKENAIIHDIRIEMKDVHEIHDIMQLDNSSYRIFCTMYNVNVGDVIFQHNTKLDLSYLLLVTDVSIENEDMNTCTLTAISCQTSEHPVYLDYIHTKEYEFKTRDRYHQQQYLQQLEIFMNPPHHIAVWH